MKLPQENSQPALVKSLLVALKGIEGGHLHRTGLLIRALQGGDDSLAGAGGAGNHQNTAHVGIQGQEVVDRVHVGSGVVGDDLSGSQNVNSVLGAAINKAVVAVHHHGVGGVTGQHADRGDTLFRKLAHHVVADVIGVIIDAVDKVGVGLAGSQHILVDNVPVAGGPIHAGVLAGVAQLGWPRYP